MAVILNKPFTIHGQVMDGMRNSTRNWALSEKTGSSPGGGQEIMKARLLQLEEFQRFIGSHILLC